MSSERLIIAADPGRHAAIAAIHVHEKYPAGCAMVDHFRFCTPKGVKHYLTGEIGAFEGWCSGIDWFHDAVEVIIEEPFAMHSQSSVSTLTTGTNYGSLRAVLIIVFSDHDLVKPGQWKKDLGLSGKGKTKTEMKHESLDMARELFPEAADNLKLAKDHDLAEALLIGYWHYKHKLEV